MRAPAPAGRGLVSGWRSIDMVQSRTSPVLAYGVLVAFAGLAIVFDLKPAGFLVVCAGVGLVGVSLATAMLSGRSTIDQLIATVTLGASCLAVVAEGLSLLALLGSTGAWIVATTACGIGVGSVVRRRSPAAP